VICSIVALAAGCAGESPEVPVGSDGRADAVLLQGRDIFSTRCATCHGADGGGGQGPKLNDGRVAESYPDIAAQIAVVTGGLNGMPSFSNLLGEEEIEAVVRYTREVL
jgi:mono/diheme cytochrome c family protein